MNKYVLAAILTAAVGLSALAANAATHKKHHSSQSTQRSTPSTTTTGMSKGNSNQMGSPNAGYQLSK
jgi:hypothetical protein